ncbi:uncharacterized protein [Equus asinus]|uniref:uncharacterized protein isoform X2 n=1 Tax=Equus asinus TaxID=9793 RepID=UPI0038F61D6D
MSALQSGRRGRRRPPGPGTRAGDWRACGGRGAARRALALRSGRARLRAAPLLAPLWLLAPTPGSHMTPAPLALRASRGWRELRPTEIMALPMPKQRNKDFSLVSFCCGREPTVLLLYSPKWPQGTIRRPCMRQAGGLMMGEPVKILFKSALSQQVHQKAIEHLLEHIMQGSVRQEFGQGTMEMSSLPHDVWSLSWECQLDTYMWSLVWLDSERDHLERELLESKPCKRTRWKLGDLPELTFRTRQHLSSPPVVPANP